jgi:tetratricopeptide (TPR) repeat protein
MAHRITQAILLSCTFALLRVPMLSQTTQSSPARQRATPTTQSVQRNSPYDDAVAKARALAAQKNFKDAVAAGEQAIQMDDNRWEGYVVSAEAYSGQQLYDDAIGMLQSALTRAPQEKKPLIRDAITETRRQLSAPQAAAAPPPAAATTVQAPAAALPAANPGAPTQAEIVLWKSIESSKSAADYQGYLDAYPTGVYAPVANRRLQEFNRPAEDSAKAAQKIRELLSWLQENQDRGEETRGKIAFHYDITSINGCVITNVATMAGVTQRVEAIDLRRVNSESVSVVPRGNRWSVSVTYENGSEYAIFLKDRATAAEALDKVVEASQLCNSMPSNPSRTRSDAAPAAAPAAVPNFQKQFGAIIGGNK